MVLTERMTGSSIVIARTVRLDTATIFFIVDDPSRIATLITQSFSDVSVTS